MAGRNAIPVRASGGIRRFGGDCGTAPERSRPGQSLPSVEAGIRLFPQACPPADTACGDRLCREAGPAKSPPTPGTATPSSPLYSKETSFLSNPIRPGWVISPAFPPERAGLYPAIVKGLCIGKRVGCAFSSPIDTTPTLEAVDRVVRRCTPSKGLIFHSNQASNTPRSPSGNGWRSMESGRACPARAIPTTTPWQGISSAASSAS